MLDNEQEPYTDKLNPVNDSQISNTQDNRIQGRDTVADGEISFQADVDYVVTNNPIKKPEVGPDGKPLKRSLAEVQAYLDTN